MIGLSSRYFTGYIANAYDAAIDRGVTTVYRNFPKRNNVSYILHDWSSTDRLDLLAYKYYGDSTMWWKILDFNPKIHSPADLISTSSNTAIQIRIPLD